jgi:hypothetical protein
LNFQIFLLKKGGNINWLGSHKQCNNIENTDFEPEIRGRYCRARITLPLELLGDKLDGVPLPENTGLNLGLCISRACDNRQVASLVSNCDDSKLLNIFFVSCDNSNYFNFKS